MIGWIGVALLMFAYCLFGTKKWSHLFVPINMVASVILTIHAWTIHDTSFVIVNGFMALILCKKMFDK